MPHADTEDQLVEQPAIGVVRGARLDHGVGIGGNLRRDRHVAARDEGRGGVVVSRLRAALERLNPALPPEAITAAVDELTRNRSAMSLEAVNREVYLLRKEGIKVSVLETESTPHPGPAPEPTLHPSQKGNLRLVLQTKLPSWEGLGVGSGAQGSKEVRGGLSLRSRRRGSQKRRVEDGEVRAKLANGASPSVSAALRRDPAEFQNRLSASTFTNPHIVEASSPR